MRSYQLFEGLPAVLETPDLNQQGSLVRKGYFIAGVEPQCRIKCTKCLINKNDTIFLHPDAMKKLCECNPIFWTSWRDL